ncbi:hypothetical protein NDU88_005500 [Pleurodeles waltl]|uniref:Uncharacterized protein n=1 Tax=Pleurodeles waltl TaxID=8319 RepID=A0AAV7WZP8_PLEWA|nr:hypothetical protein NDU88_005500 [Pleurodeles waltl]
MSHGRPKLRPRALEGAGGCCAPPDPRGNAAGSRVKADMLCGCLTEERPSRGSWLGSQELEGAGDRRGRSRA